MGRHERFRPSNPASLDIHWHAKQWRAFESAATEILYGGAAGGGKSFLLRTAAIVWASAIPGLQVYLFRRISDDLIKNHVEGPKGFRSLLASWTATGWCEIVRNEIRFWNGSKIYLCHCQDESDVYKYQGAEIHVLLIDELTHFTEQMYRFLRNRVRMVGIDLPDQYRGQFPRILCGANPGNIGHLWVKAAFVVAAAAFNVWQTGSTEGGMLRQFIPAQLEDNPSMAVDDPGYEQRLEGLGSPELVRAMRHGDWDVIEGAFFPEFTRQHHVIAPFAIPGHWVRFRSGDWGSAKPFSIGWWAVVGDDWWVGGDAERLLGPAADQSERVDERYSRSGYHAASPAAAYRQAASPLLSGDRGQGLRLLQRDQPGHLNRHLLPRGALIRYRELYGASAPDVGLRLPAEAVADRIKELQAPEEKIDYSVMDPAAFASDGGKSIAERMSDRGVHFMRADNSRVPLRGAMGGWDQVRSRLVGTCERLIDGQVHWETGRPMLYVFSTCLDLIRTLPAMQHDKHRPEDMDTDGEDHAVDDLRYACMSRPYTRSAPVVHPMRGAAEMTMDEAWKLATPQGRRADARI